MNYFPILLHRDIILKSQEILNAHILDHLMLEYIVPLLSGILCTFPYDLVRYVTTYLGQKDLEDLYDNLVAMLFSGQKIFPRNYLIFLTKRIKGSRTAIDTVMKIIEKDLNNMKTIHRHFRFSGLHPLYKNLLFSFHRPRLGKALSISMRLTHRFLTSKNYEDYVASIYNKIQSARFNHYKGEVGKLKNYYGYLVNVLEEYIFYSASLDASRNFYLTSSYLSLLKETETHLREYYGNIDISYSWACEVKKKLLSELESLQKRDLAVSSVILALSPKDESKVSFTVSHVKEEAEHYSERADCSLEARQKRYEEGLKKHHEQKEREKKEALRLQREKEKEKAKAEKILKEVKETQKSRGEPKKRSR